MEDVRTDRRGGRLLGLVVAALVALVAAAPAQASVLAKLEGGFGPARAEALAERHGLEVGRTFPEIGWVELVPAGGDAPTARAARATRARLEADPAVAATDGRRAGERLGPAVQPQDELWAITSSIVNPVTGSEIAQPAWHFRTANFPAAWDVSRGSAGAAVAVIDTEFWTPHPDLRDKFLPGLNLSPLDTRFGTYQTPDVRGTPADNGQFHGTHVAGLVGAATNNTIGVSGAGWESPVIPVKVSFLSPSVVADVTQAIGYAASRGPVAINMSFGGTAFHPAWQDAIRAARARGIVLVAASSNDQVRRPGFAQYPAAMDGVLAVGATTPSDDLAFFSSTGEFVDITAPGDPVLSTWDQEIASNYANGYHVTGGTSMAAPLVAGLVALIKARRPELTPDQVETIIQRTAVDRGLPGKDQNYGWGRIDAGRALADAATFTAAPPPPPPPPPPAAAPRTRLTRVTVTVTPRRPRAGRLVRVSGRVRPGIGDVRVRVQTRRFGRRTYRTVRTLRTSPRGRFTARVRMGRRGNVELRAVALSSASVAGRSSAPVALRVR